jgi:hypothetical protein
LTSYFSHQQCNPSFIPSYPTQIAAETFEEIQSNVLQGSKVVLDVEEEGLDERSIISLDAATRITKSGISCFSSSDGKERCYVDALPGECDSVNSFGTDGRRRAQQGKPQGKPKVPV